MMSSTAAATMKKDICDFLDFTDFDFAENPEFAENQVNRIELTPFLFFPKTLSFDLIWLLN
jgi:hypothetical protein